MSVAGIDLGEVFLGQLAKWGSGSQHRRRFLVLLYHRVLEDGEDAVPGGIERELFQAHLEVIQRHFCAMTLSEAVRAMERGTLPRATVCVTFDDGYADNFGVALPLLKQASVPATFFIATGFLDGGCMWNDIIVTAIQGTKETRINAPDLTLDELSLRTELEKSAAIDRVLNLVKYGEPELREERAYQLAERLGVEPPTELMMTSDQIAGLAAEGMEIGAHTATHPILLNINDAEAYREIVSSKAALEDITGRRVDSFAYPNGKPRVDFDARHLGMVRDAGFTVAATTAWGRVESLDTQRYQIPRIGSWDRTKLRFAGRLIRGLQERGVSELV